MAEKSRTSTARGFRVECREDGDLLIVACHGRLTYGNTQALKDDLKDRIPGHQRVIFDLKDVPQMDSSGL